jgi:hypothetical protein
VRRAAALRDSSGAAAHSSTSSGLYIGHDAFLLESAQRCALIVHAVHMQRCNFTTPCSDAALQCRCNLRDLRCSHRTCCARPMTTRSPRRRTPRRPRALPLHP